MLWYGIDVSGQLLGLQDRLMLADFVHSHDKVYLVPTTGRTVAAKAGPGIRFGIHLHARGLVIMEGAAKAVVTIAL